MDFEVAEVVMPIRIKRYDIIAKEV